MFSLAAMYNAEMLMENGVKYWHQKRRPDFMHEVVLHPV